MSDKSRQLWQNWEKIPEIVLDASERGSHRKKKTKKKLISRVRLISQTLQDLILKKNPDCFRLRFTAALDSGGIISYIN